jgi:hypothetical protein
VDGARGLSGTLNGLTMLCGARAGSALMWPRLPERGSERGRGFGSNSLTVSVPLVRLRGARRAGVAWRHTILGDRLRASRPSGSLPSPSGS